MTTFPIDPKALEAASLAMSTEETRYYLCGVHLTKTPDRPGDVCYQATDGHRLFRAWADPEKGREPLGELDAIVPAQAVKRIVAYAKANKSIVPNNLVATVGDGRIRVVNVLEGDDVVVDTRLIDGTFPDAERVIPALDPERKVPEAIGFNLEYMASIAKAAKLATGSRQVKVRLNDPSSPARFEARNFLAVMMPCRV